MRRRFSPLKQRMPNKLNFSEVGINLILILLGKWSKWRSYHLSPSLFSIPPHSIGIHWNSLIPPPPKKQRIYSVCGLLLKVSCQLPDKYTGKLTADLKGWPHYFSIQGSFKMIPQMTQQLKPEQCRRRVGWWVQEWKLRTGRHHDDLANFHDWPIIASWTALSFREFFSLKIKWSLDNEDGATEDICS